ncbi:MAG: response regulator [Alteraurantiacibacter sp.]
MQRQELAREIRVTFDMKHSVLVVEDDFLNRLLLVTLLEAEGYEVVEASNGQAALAVLDVLIPKLIVMDINMPEMNGMELMAKLKIRSEWRDIPILAVTAYFSSSDEHEIRSAGADELISKPISNKRFISVTSHVIANAAPGCQG